LIASRPSGAARAKPASVLILGSGPVVIGQAAEFDYAGMQACRALRAEGVRTILINSNPATNMTDPTVANAIYLEPLTVEAVEAVIARKRYADHSLRHAGPSFSGEPLGARRKRLIVVVRPHFDTQDNHRPIHHGQPTRYGLACCPRRARRSTAESAPPAAAAAPAG
jgi:hypothetical protein